VTAVSALALRHPLILGLAILGATPASGEAKSKIVIIPTGAGAALPSTVAVARSLAARLGAAGQAAFLAYPAPPIPVDPKAKQKERQAAARLKKAQSAFEMMEYDKVKSIAEEGLKAYKELVKSGGGAPASEGLLLAHHLLAAAAQLQGENKEAYRWMNDAFLFDPRPPSKKVFSPTVQELFERVKSEPARRGSLQLSTNPAALVFFNGKLFGMGRGRATVRAGLYLVRVYLPGYASQQRWVRVEADQERPLAATLERDESPEEESLAQLRGEARGGEPGPTTNQALVDYGADEVVVLTAEGCSGQSARCPLQLRWAKDGRWLKRGKAEHSVGRADATAAVLLGEKPKEVPATQTGPIGPALRSCSFDSDCGVKEQCRGGRCARTRSVTRSWWFWTLVGVGATGVALAIALPLSAPPRPTIEVR
jgi:hypothetical protein